MWVRASRETFSVGRSRRRPCRNSLKRQKTRAENNGKNLNMATVITFVVRDGKITEGREFFEDTAKADDFWT